MKAIVSLTTIPTRLKNEKDLGIKSCIESLLNQNGDEYEIHFNIPYVNAKTKENYLIPGWLHDVDPKLKIYRTDDYGSITKLAPTIKRTEDPSMIIITCDDDLVYHPDMVTEQIKNQTKFENCSVGYDGITLRDSTLFPNGDPRRQFATSLAMDAEVKILQGYKSVSHKRSFFEDDFFTDFVGKSWCDDTVISAYLGSKNIKRMVTYHPTDPVLKTAEEWRQGGGPCKSFPVLKSTNHEHKEGCNLWRADGLPRDPDNSLFPYIDRIIT